VEVVGEKEDGSHVAVEDLRLLSRLFDDAIREVSVLLYDYVYLTKFYG
jgi:hypothetical protein